MMELSAIYEDQFNSKVKLTQDAIEFLTNDVEYFKRRAEETKQFSQKREKELLPNYEQIIVANETKMQTLTEELRR